MSNFYLQNRDAKSGCRFDGLGFLRWKVFPRFLQMLPLLCFFTSNIYLQNGLARLVTRARNPRCSCPSRSQRKSYSGIGDIGKANRRKGQRPFFLTLEASNASFCLGASNCRSDGGLIIGARCARIDIRKHCAPIIKRRINGDFTRQAGVGKIGNANFSEGGKTPCFIYKTYRRSLGFAASCRRLSGEGRRITHTQNLRL